MAWNDAMWAKYKIGTALNLTDPETKAPVARNWFFQPKKTDPVFLNGLARGCVPADDELFFSRARSAGLSGADVAIQHFYMF